MRPLRKSHVGQPPSAVHHTLFRRRRGRLRYILMRKDSDRDFRRGLKMVCKKRGPLYDGRVFRGKMASPEKVARFLRNALPALLRIR